MRLDTAVPAYRRDAVRHGQRDRRRRRVRRRADSAGNGPGLDEAIRAQRASKGCSQPWLAVATAPVEETAGHVVPIGAEFALTHVVLGALDDAREAFAARCQRQDFEILEPSTVEAITLEDLLQRVNDPDSSLGSIYPTQ